MRQRGHRVGVAVARKGFRAWLEDRLPWYDAAIEAKRRVWSERLATRTDEAMARAERVITTYEEAAAAEDKAGRALIREARRK